MSPKIESTPRGSIGGAPAATPHERPPRAPDPEGPPSLPLDGGFAGLGIEGLAAMLAVDSARKLRDLSRQLEDGAKQSQLAELKQQVECLRDKAADVRGEGVLAGALLIGGGSASLAGAAMGPGTAESMRGSASELRRSAADCVQQAESSTQTLAHDFADVAGEQATKLEVGAAVSAALSPAGAMLTALAPNLAKATYGAAQVYDDATATQHAAAAKFAENAKDEFANLGRDARATIDKAEQALQSFVQERTAAKRAILRM